MSLPITLPDLMQLLKQYDVYGPRYTSYPTALQFNENFTEQDYRQHALSSNQHLLPKPLSLYLHIPFCQSLCFYCGCNKVITRDASKGSAYLDYLYQEIALQAEIFANDRLVQQVHFGGGTPTFLNNAQLREALEVLAQSFHLGLPDTLDLGIEIDPRTVSVKRMNGLLEMGFNRISLGVQDFDPQVQQAINREQSLECIQNLERCIRSYGVHSLSFDLIYGLPKQSLQSFSRTLDEVIQLRPDRISLYNYAHLPQRIPSQRLIKSEQLPSAEVKLEIFIESIRRLTAAGYIYIGMDHFALPEDSLARSLTKGGLQRNFQGYSTHADCDIIGLGVSAISHVDDSYSQNVGELSAYRSAISNNRLPLKRGLSLSQDDLVRADVIQQLMCQGGVCFKDFGAKHGIQFQEYFVKEYYALENMALDGLLSLSSEGVEIAELGRLILRNIAMVFDKYLSHATIIDSDTPRYSKTL